MAWMHVSELFSNFPKRLYMRMCMYTHTHTYIYIYTHHIHIYIYICRYNLDCLCLANAIVDYSEACKISTACKDGSLNICYLHDTWSAASKDCNSCKWACGLQPTGNHFLAQSQIWIKTSRYDTGMISSNLMQYVLLWSNDFVRVHCTGTAWEILKHLFLARSKLVACSPNWTGTFFSKNLSIPWLLRPAKSRFCRIRPARSTGQRDGCSQPSRLDNARSSGLD